MANMSKLILGAAIAVAAIVVIEKPAEAQGGGWCAYYNEAFGSGKNCGFVTLQQCLAEVPGVGGNCSPSPYYEAPNYYRYPPGYRY